MRAASRNQICFYIAAICFLPQMAGRAAPQLSEKADQIFDAARQTVTDVIGVAQGAVNQAIDGAKTTVINDIDNVQDAARLGLVTGRNIIDFGETVILRTLNATGR